MKQLKRRELGHTGIMVSEMGLGCMSYGGHISQAESFARMNDYLALGGNFFDTANIYGRSMDGTSQAGESEAMIGRWLKANGKRSEIVLASKVGFPYPGMNMALLVLRSGPNVKRPSSVFRPIILICTIYTQTIGIPLWRNHWKPFRS